ncbi:uncharacterized protein BT62DRAFT_939066 [Guyanagaster necrorhizus]|uniref:Uncharacterized protein n=1 Tax=Guyanagaster necrorhizus TaxID=856835 RepID=A0A9P7VFR4_9AGAR|nr:uncharacterized protein BT62DRAFT_939066 [Guyanagaster necrorhizus MCA 3950]KAG7439331.1 hypothetical protein BT62DRAFT_939066 [Guyanagaster necrorhizus MCA 3950]
MHTGPSLTGFSLQLFDDAQQEFSAEGYPTLCLVIPALERLHRNLSKSLNALEYAPFPEAIQVSLAAIERHYFRVENSDAYIICSGQ